MFPRAAPISLRCLSRRPLESSPTLLVCRYSVGSPRAFNPYTQNLTLNDAEIRFIDGDAMVVRDSDTINIDAGEYEE